MWKRYFSLSEMSWTLTRPNIRSQAHGSIKSMRFFYFRWKEENDAKANELSQGQATVLPGFTVLVCCRAPPAGRTASAFELSSATNKKIRDSGNDKFPESLAFSCSVQQGKRDKKRFQQNVAHLSNLLTLLLFQKILYGLSDNLRLRNALRRTKQHFLNQEQQSFTGF